MRFLSSRATYAVIVICALIFLGIVLFLDVLDPKDVGIGLLALLGTLSGATLAFRLNEDKESKKEEADQKSALNRALFVLIRQKNATELIGRELEPFKTPFARAFNFPAVKTAPYQDLVHRFEELEFLLNTPEVNVLMQLAVEQERFHQMLESLRIRNEFYVHRLQPEIAEQGLNGKENSVENAKQLLGELLFDTATNYAEILRDHVESSTKSILAMYEELRAAANRLYPKSKFIGFTNPNAQHQNPADEK